MQNLQVYNREIDLADTANEVTSSFIRELTAERYRGEHKTFLLWNSQLIIYSGTINE